MLHAVLNDNALSVCKTIHEKVKKETKWRLGKYFSGVHVEIEKSE